MSQREYIPGDTVFAKLKGYPWWPARIEDDREVPPKILKQKGKSKGLLYTVFFYGSRDYGFFGPDCIRPFDRESVQRDLKDKKFKTKDLEIAVHQALDPSILKAEEEAEAAAAAAAEEEEDEEQEEEDDEEKEDKALEDDEEEEEEVIAKSKRKERKKPTSTISNTAADKKKKPITPKKRSPSKKAIDDQDAENAENNRETVPPTSPSSSSTQQKKAKASTKKASVEKNKRARLLESDSATESDRKKRRKSLSTEQEEDHHTKRESSTLSRKSEEPSNHNMIGHIEKQEDLDAFKKTPEYKKIYHIRHKLQKLVYEKKPGEIQKDDFARVSQVVKEIEDSQMTYDLLRYTKIGKVVKFACSYDYGEDEYRINQRCQQMMKNWKSLVIPENRSASAEQHEQQS